MRFVPSSSVLVLALSLAACAGGSRVAYEGPEDAYRRGMEYLDAGKYAQAIPYLQGVFDFGRTHEWAADAQLALARAYRLNEEYLLAANEYTRFTQIYRSDERVPQASFDLAMTYYDRAPEYRLDQSDTEAAINQFQLYMTRYPDGPLAEEAGIRIVELRNRLAQKRFDAGLQYEARGLHEAAGITFESVFDEYFDTEWADDALVAAIRAYTQYADESVQTRKAERLERAVASYERLLQIFPGSPLVKEAEALYRVAADRLADLRKPAPAAPAEGGASR